MKKRTKKKLLAYAMASGAITGTTEYVDAQVVHTDLNPDIVLTFYESYQIDFNHDASTDVTIHHEGVITSSYGPPGKKYGYFSLTIDKPVSNSFAGSFNSGNSIGYPGMLNSAFSLGSGNAWEANSGSIIAMLYYNATSSSSIYGNWQQNTSEKFLGMKFHAADGIHYGWVRLSIGNIMNDFQVTIHDYAYESAINTSILTGDTGSVTPVDNNTKLENCNIYTYGGKIYINTINHKPVKVEIINPLGQLIKTLELSGDDSLREINVPNREGVYIVKVSDELGSYSSKKVVVR